MVVQRIEQLIRSAKEQRGGAVLPYFTSGYPDRETCAELIRRADAVGAAVVEIGIPYSDSIADGPVIQESFHRSLEQGHRLEHAFDLAASVRPHVGCGLVAMLSFSIVHRIGLDLFLQRAKDAGFDGVILPDVPAEEAAPIADAIHSAGLCHIGLIAPTTSPERRASIVRLTSGFVYQIAVAGTTGERAHVAKGLASDVSSLQRSCSLPVCVGFGVSTPEHVRVVCEVADGVIVGSAIIRRITEELEAGHGPGRIVENVAGFLSRLVDAAGK